MSTSPVIANRLARFGQTIFTEISALALKHNAINLGQGFPNFDGPEFIKRAAIEAIEVGQAQYARSFGVPPLNFALAERFRKDTGREIDANANITVTSGCTEAIAATMLGLINPGDEVVVFEPYYDSYPACLSMAGAVPKFVTLRPPTFEVDETALRSAFSDKTRAVLINTPHNPTGKIFTRRELQLIAELCIKHNAIAIMDEVYERLVFEGEHVRMCTLPGMWERTVTLSSLGKTFSLTGWKIGWAIAPGSLTGGIRAAHQFLTFATATPLQHGAVAAINAPDSYYDEFVAEYRTRRDILVEGLARIGFEVYPPAGTYFVLADHTRFGFGTDVAFCKHMIEEIGVAAIPPSSFYHDAKDGYNLVRFAFCKTEDTLREALERMAKLKA